MLALVQYVLYGVVATAIVWKGSDWLEAASERLATHYGLPDIVQGAVIAAVGSSFPELASVVVATLAHGSFELGVAAIVGSAIFNVLVIPGIAALVGEGTLAASRDLVYKDAQFYMLSVAVLLLTFSFAVIYFPVETETGSLGGTVTPGLALIPLGLYCLYIFLQFLDTTEHEPPADRERIAVGRQWALLLASLVVIVAGVELLVQAALGFGDFFDTPDFFWGLTVIAAGTSLPDALVSIRTARKGKGVTSTANVLGSNIFDLLVAIPAGVLLGGATAIDFGRAAPMMGALTLATILLFTYMRTGMEMTRREGYSLLVAYVLFVAWMALETVGVTSVVL